MQNILHATFAKAEDGIQAVESLLFHKVSPEDINLILPQPQPTASEQTVAPAEGVEPTAHPHSIQTAKSSTAHDREAAVALDADVPPVPQLPPLPRRDSPRSYGNEDFMAPGAPAYTYDAMGAVIPDPVKTTAPQAPASADHTKPLAIVDAEEGAGLGLGLGLLTACAIPGVGLLVGAGTIVAGLMAGGMVAGGIGGGIFGYLTDHGIGHATARAMSDHLEAGGTTLSVTVSDAGKKAEIVRIIEAFGGHLIGQS